MSPGCQKTLSTSVTGSPVISPKRLARVDLPDAPRPMMTTRFMVSSLRRYRFGSKRADCWIVRVQVERKRPRRKPGNLSSNPVILCLWETFDWREVCQRRPGRIGNQCAFRFESLNSNAPKQRNTAPTLKRSPFPDRAAHRASIAPATMNNIAAVSRAVAR
jgi:hypothetical protein